MGESGRQVPVHYQEPFRRGFSSRWQPSAEDFAADLRQALSGGAAGWCFHNGDQRDRPDGRPRRCFDLRQRRLLEQLADVASACKPVFVHFLFKAIEEGRIPDLDAPVVRWEPRLKGLNATR